MKTGLLAACAASLLGVASIQGAVVSIDGLSQGSLSLSATGANQVDGTNESSVDAIGGTRAVSIDHLFDSETSTATLSTGGPLTVNGTNSSNSYLTLGYGLGYSGGGMGPTTNLNADLSGTDALQIDFGSISGPVFVVATLATASGGPFYGQSTNNGGPSIFVNSAGNYVLPYSVLSAQNGGATLSDIDYIQLNLQSASQFTVANVSAITTPEPVTLAPLVCVGLMARRRRRRR